LVPLSGGQELAMAARSAWCRRATSPLRILSRLGDVSHASLTPQLIQVIDRVTRYTDGLNPLFETAVPSPAPSPTRNRSDRAVAGQHVIDRRGLSGFHRRGDRRLHTSHRLEYYPGQTFPRTRSCPSCNTRTRGRANTNLADEKGLLPQFVSGVHGAGVERLFGSVGKLETSHVDDLLPLISGIKALTDVTPPY